MKRSIKILLFAMLVSATNGHAQDKKEYQKATRSNSEAKQTTLTAQDRDYAIKFLMETEAGVYKSIKDLSEAQLKFKPAQDKWSVDECVKHIAAAEESLWAMVDASLKQNENPDKRADIKFTDQELVNAVEDRSHKSKTFAALEPSNSPYKSKAEAVAAFKLHRGKLINFVKSTSINLRNHVSVLPIGTYDAYQFILLISAHTNRHTQQIDEVKATVDFPKQ